jgi:hypothetical protein
MVDEVNTCWALINLQRCAELSRDMEVAVPLYCADMYSPTSLDRLLQEERKRHPVKSFFKPAKPALLVFRAGPLPTANAPLLPYRWALRRGAGHRYLGGCVRAVLGNSQQ